MSPINTGLKTLETHCIADEMQAAQYGRNCHSLECEQCMFTYLCPPYARTRTLTNEVRYCRCSKSSLESR